MTRRRYITFGLILLLLFQAGPRQALAWGRGHRLIRLWAVSHLPDWQRERIGKAHLARLCRDYTSLQDKHAGGKAPELDPYCVIPGVRLSLHDLNPPVPSAKAILWYLERIDERLDAGETDEAMKYLGVLCHWNEDPGCPSAHSSPVTEAQLKRLLPPPPDKSQFNYLYGYGGIADVGDYRIPDEEYRPRLLGATWEEAALRIYQHQRLLERAAAAHIVPIVQDMMYGDGSDAAKHRSAAALNNARHVADVIYTVVCLATERVDPEEAGRGEAQKLSEWIPDPGRRMIGHPYYVTPYLVNQSMDADRGLHALAFPGEKDASNVKSGYGVGAPKTLDFTLAPGGVYGRFTCRVGLHPTAGERGEVAFVVEANGRKLHQTEPIRSGQPPQRIDVALPAGDVLKLSLKTLPGDPADSKHNLAVWGEPTLHRAD